MPHCPKPFFRKQTRTWYVRLDRKFINLGPDYDKAQAMYHKLMLRRPRIDPDTDPDIKTLAAAYGVQSTAWPNNFEHTGGDESRGGCKSICHVGKND